MLNIDQIRKTYQGPDGTVHAVDGISLRIEAKEYVALQGPSGCGKSTLLLMTGGLLEPDGGKITIGEQNPYTLSPEQRAAFRAANIGFVFQQFHLVPYLSVLDNIMAPSLALAQAESRPRAEELIERLGLKPRTHHVPAELSTGERQRVALARALLNRPKLLLADEPTGNLDSESARTVLEQMGAFAESGGAVLLATHDPKAAESAQRSIRLRAGKLVDD